VTLTRRGTLPKDNGRVAWKCRIVMLWTELENIKRVNRFGLEVSYDKHLYRSNQLMNICAAADAGGRYDPHVKES